MATISSRVLAWVFGATICFVLVSYLATRFTPHFRLAGASGIFMGVAANGPDVMLVVYNNATNGPRIGGMTPLDTTGSAFISRVFWKFPGISYEGLVYTNSSSFTFGVSCWLILALLGILILITRPSAQRRLPE